MSVLSKALSFVALILLVSGCAVTSSPPLADDGRASDAEQATESANAGASLTSPATAETGTPLTTSELASLADLGLGVQLERGANFTRVAVNTGAAQPAADVMTLTNPARLVVDLPDTRIASNKNFPIESDNYIRGIRMGSHNKSARIVFDLTEYAANALEAEHKVDTSTGRVLVTFYNQQEPAVNLAGATSATTEIARLESAEQTASESQTSDVAAAESIQDEASAEAEQIAAASPSETPLSSALLVDSLQFTKAQKNSGQVMIALSDEAAFKMEQTTPSEYVLTVPGAIAAERTTLPQIAPQGFPGFRSVRAVQQGNDVQVRMFIDPGVTLNATPRGKDIIILADAKLAAGARAQLADEPATSAATQAAGETSVGAAPSEGVIAADGSKVYVGRLISLDLQDTDIDNALRIIAEVSNLNIIASDDVQGKVTLRLIDVPWDQALDVILKTNGLDQVKEGNVIRIAPVEKLRAEREALKEAKRAAEELEDLAVKYIRISYARATEIKEQTEAVLSERGSVSVDERTNQLIIKDIAKGQTDVIELVKKLDLRTPQVLLETQIVESQRNILRDLGFQWNFQYSRSPQTGNATGLNFPNSVVVGGAAGEAGATGPAVNFPAVLTDTSGSAISAILDSADGSRLLSARLSALESEGKARVISRPQVATVNNKQAQIKSVETVRVRLPDSGLSVATGSGASASGGGSTAFEEIDVGIELTVTPQASPDYYVLLDIHAKSSTFGATVVDNIPSTLEREATSTILVKSGQTFALGGVYRIEDNDSVEGVPFLKDIPFLGHVFRRTLVDKADEELIFFITPHIVEGSFDPSLM